MLLNQVTVLQNLPLSSLMPSAIATIRTFDYEFLQRASKHNAAVAATPKRTTKS